MADPTIPAASATPDRPWLGLAHFTAADRDYFYGREDEIRLLADRVRRTPLVILYGVSGYGKSSLLGAGLIPALEETGFSVTLLRRCYESLATRPLVADVIAEVAAAHPGTRAADGGTLWEFFHDLSQPWLHSPDRDGNPPPKPVLVLDQFEEIFTRGEDRDSKGKDDKGDARARKHARDFLEQLADVVENRPPAALRSLLESGTAEQRRAILSRYDFDVRPVRCVLALRDDFLAHLERWRRAMPSMMEHRVELQLLSGRQAFEAVFKPGAKRPDQQPIIPRDAAEAIVRTVARAAASTPLAEIEAVPSLLSLLCEQLNLTRLADDPPAAQIGATDVADRSIHILQQFYDESFTPIPQSHREKVRAFVEDGMISETGHRHPVAREAAENQLKKSGVPDPAAVFDELIARRLLAAEEQKGSTLLEITHDVLIPLILASRDERQKGMALAEQAEQLAAEKKKVAEAAKKARQQLRIALVMSGLMAAAVAAAAIAWHLHHKAIGERDNARYNEGLGWLLRAEVAEERGKQYPGSLLYAANAIGFDGAGRAGTKDDPVQFITRERDPGRHEMASKWLEARPSYVPVWSSATGGTPLEALAFSPTGRHLAAGGKGGRAILWDLATGGSGPLATEGSADIADLAFHPDGTRLAISSDSLKIREFATAAVLGGPLPAASALAYGPDGRILIAAAESRLILHVENREPVAMPGPGRSARRISFSADNSAAAAIEPETGVLLCFPRSEALSNAWATLMNQPSPPHRDATSLALSPDGRLLAIGNTRGSISLWDVAAATWRSEISTDQRHQGAVLDLCYRSDGEQLASGSDDGTVKLWTLDPAHPAPAIAATLTGHEGAVNRVRYAPGSGLLASCGADGSAKLWNVSGEPADHVGLYRYIRDGWYVPGLDTKPPVWGGKSGFIGLPSSSLAALWQQPSPLKGVAGHLAAARDWPAVISVLPRIDSSEREAITPLVVAALATDAKEAAAGCRWSRVDLRLEQWDELGNPENADLTEIQQRREAISTEGKSFINCEKIELVWCPSGEFTMGSPLSEDDRQPVGEVQHPVTHTHGFWIGKFEVTQKEYVSVSGAHKFEHSDVDGSRPAERIDWHQAMEFCRKLTDRERSRGTLPAGWEYSLPTKAQWEYACRAENTGAYCFGNDPSQLHRFGNFRDKRYPRPGSSPEPGSYDDSQDDGFNETSPVGKYEANKWGIHDMHGNVLEWCLDRAGGGHIEPGQIVHLSDPVGTEGTNRQARGGSFQELPKNCRSARGFSFTPTRESPDCGMRVALVRVRPVP